MRVTQWLEEFRDDVKFAIRQGIRSPGFTLIAALTLALGIGANSAIFALVDATLLRPLPFPEPDRLVMIWERSDTQSRGRVSGPNLLDWNDQNRTFETMAGFVPNVGGMVMAGADGNAETVPRQWVTAGIFDALGLNAIVGRTFLPGDVATQPSAVVLSEGFWHSRFGGNPSIVGQEIRLDGDLFTVVGVVPASASLLGQSSIWAAVPINRAPNQRGARGFQAIGRLKPGVTLDAAAADMAAVADGLAREFPATNAGRGVTLDPLRDALVGVDLRLTSLLFLGVVGFVLLICCVNVANLLLARATVRARELAIRSAIGAGQGRVVRQLLTESLVLAVAGGALGLAVGAAILDVAPSLIPPGLLPGAVTLAFDMRVATFCTAAALLVGLLFGLAPAWHATQLSSASVSASGSRGATGRGGNVRNLLVAAEVAAATLVLCGAGLLLRTLLAVESVDRGYRADRVLTMMVDPLGSRYPANGPLQQFLADVEQEIRALPGVSHVAWVSTLPMGPSQVGRLSFEIVGDAPLDESRRPSADYQVVSPSYFETLDLPLVAGRSFTDRDTGDSVPVCIVNEAFVRGFLQGRSPIGARVSIRPIGDARAPAVVREIVGVARQVKGQPDETEDLLQIYVPFAQFQIGDIYLAVRPASGSAEALAAPVRAAISRIDREQLVSVRGVMTLEDVARDATSRHRFRAVMVLMLAGLALLLAMVGVFGILSYSVQQRVREFGVRMALGASVGDILRLVAWSALRVMTVGVVTGLALAAVFARFLSGVLFGVAPIDPVTFASVGLLLLITALVASAAPAWRAARVDPAVTLRSE